MSNIPNDTQCPHCGRYANRGISIDAVIIRDNQILLIQRGAEPFRDYWGTPGGYVGWDETTEETVIREVKEETGLNVISTKLVGVYSAPTRHPKQVINIVYLVNVKDGVVKHGDDALDARWFPVDKLPEQMALDHKQNIQDAKKFLTAN
ncbi:MAG: NUDIX hydrolase [Candidatus Gottesmanbacteria bacterium]|nr:NUDIX hydrolase [Candidatus Gottesmanbacteria bacterium]